MTSKQLTTGRQQASNNPSIASNYHTGSFNLFFNQPRTMIKLASNIPS
jgi:hypothetical protein